VHKLVLKMNVENMHGEKKKTIKILVDCYIFHFLWTVNPHILA